MSYAIQLIWLIPISLCIGSFLGVLIHRLPLGKNILKDRSICATCSARLSASDMIPVLSFIRLKGRCRYCNVPIRWEVLAIELAGLALAILNWMLFTDMIQMTFADMLTAGLLVLGWIDVKHFCLPDIISLPVLCIGLIAASFLQPSTLQDHIVGTVVGYVSFWGINAIYKCLRKRDGLGRGDAKLLALAGAWLGWQPLPTVVLVSAILGIIAAILISYKNEEELSAVTRIPFGAALCPGILGIYLVENTHILF